MIEIPWHIEEYFNQEFKKGDIKVTIISKHGNISKQYGLTFRDDGHWHGLNKKIHINDYLIQHLKYCHSCTSILINEKDLFKIDPIALPKPESTHEEEIS